MRHYLQACCLTISFGCIFNVHADEKPGLYLGASIGEATNEVGEFKGSDTAFKLTSGDSFNEHFGVELAYVDAGTQTDTVGSQHIENESSGMIVSAVMSLPLGEQFAVFGKLGYAFYESDATGRIGDLVVHESDSGDDLAYGIGAELAITGGLRLRAEYEAVDVSEGNFDILSAGVIYKF
jgi:OOP family OmpA-OmpF porin